MADRKRDMWLGIDAGTTSAVAGILAGSETFRFFAPGDPDDDPRVGDASQWLVPSAFLHIGQGQVVVGQAALKRAGQPEFSEHVVRNLALNARYGEDKAAELKSNGRDFTPARIYGETLKALRISAVTTFNRDPGLVPENIEYEGAITRLALAVPGCFGPRERTFLEQAARDTAGFSVVRLIDAPLAAALGLGLHTIPGAKNVLILNLGGGTCDMSVLRVGQEVDGGIVELGRIGCRRFGGLDFDELIARDLIRNGPLNRYDWDNERRLKYGPIDPLLLEQARQVKHEIGRSADGSPVDFNWIEPRQEMTFSASWTAQRLSEVASEYLNYIIRIGNRLLHGINRESAGLPQQRDSQETGISWMKLDEVHLVGGGALLTPLQDRLVEELGGAWNRTKLKIAEWPTRVIAEGTAIYADMHARGDVLSGLRRTRCSSDIGIRGVEDDDSFLDSVKSLSNVKTWIQPEKKKERKRVFHKMVAANSVIAEGQTAEFLIPVIETGSSGKINLSIYEQFPKQPVLEDDDDSKAGKKSRNPKPGLAYSMRRLAKIRFRNLPDPGTGEKDQIRLQLRFTANRTVEFSAAYRRQTLTSRLFGGNFEHVFDFSSATSDAGPTRSA